MVRWPFRACRLLMNMRPAKRCRHVYAAGRYDRTGRSGSVSIDKGERSCRKLSRSDSIWQRMHFRCMVLYFTRNRSSLLKHRDPLAAIIPLTFHEIIIFSERSAPNGKVGQSKTKINRQTRTAPYGHSCDVPRMTGRSPECSKVQRRQRLAPISAHRAVSTSRLFRRHGVLFGKNACCLGHAPKAFPSKNEGLAPSGSFSKRYRVIASSTVMPAFRRKLNVLTSMPNAVQAQASGLLGQVPRMPRLHNHEHWSRGPCRSLMQSSTASIGQNSSSDRDQGPPCPRRGPVSYRYHSRPSLRPPLPLQPSRARLRKPSHFLKRTVPASGCRLCWRALS